jgi:phosphoribosylaminoimidazole (AIR) synthetase
MQARAISGLAYGDAGVDIDQANRLVHVIAAVAETTHRPGVGILGALLAASARTN